jgi:spore coat protein A, manganese oxidase
MRKIKAVPLFPVLSVILLVGLAALLVTTGPALAVKPGVQTPLNPMKIPQFFQPLDTLTNGGIPLVYNGASPVTAAELSICEYKTKVLPIGTPVVGALPGVAPETWVWGYQVGSTCAPGLQNHSYLGPVVVATRGTPTEMTYHNWLPNADVANVKAYTTSTDQTLIWGDPLSLSTATTGPINLNPPSDPEANLCYEAAQILVPPALLPAPCYNNYGFLGLQALPPNAPLTYAAPTPAAVHIHGGEVPSVLDGGPDSWWTPTGIYGHGYYSRGGFADATAGKAVYRYPNGQEAAPVWFHDHMLGATRLNVYAGIAGAYLITEPAVTLAAGLDPLGLKDTVTNAVELTIPLIIQDRMFDTNGQLFFPNVGINPEHPYWVPEFVGDTICVNGKAWPYLVVEPKRYRFLFLNGSNARSYELYLSNTQGNVAPSLYVIGNDQGYLDAPQLIDPKAAVYNKLTIMPGERYEVIIDFGASAGQVLELRNTARTPWVGGAPVNGNTTGKVMQFRVNAQPVPPALPIVDNTFNPAVVPAPAIRTTPMVRLTTPLGTTPAAGVTINKTRRLTLNEVIAKGGPLEILVNNTLYDGRSPRTNLDFTPISSIWNTSYYSELPHEGETELWEILNLTADAHPMHPHLVAFQVLNRQALDVKGYTAAYNLSFPGGGLDPLTGLPYPAGVYIPGFGPPLDYACGTRWPNPTTPILTDTWAVPPRGTLDPAVCTLGGNPDPAVSLSLVGPLVPPAPQEIGWKDTVQALPNMVTRILVRFAKPELAANTSSDLAGYDFSPNHGHGYVWHCHIVDHEDNEMMRPFTVNENPGYSHTYHMGVDY